MQFTETAISSRKHMNKQIHKNIKNRIASNIYWSFIGEFAGKGILFVTNIYIARTLKVSNFGFFNLGQLIILITFWFAVDLGINMYGIREIAKNKEEADETINLLLTIRLTSAIIIFLLYTAIILIADTWVTHKYALVSSCFYIIIYALHIDWVLKGLERFKIITYSILISSAIYLVATITFVKKEDDLLPAAITWSLSYLPSCIFLLVYTYNSTGIKYRLIFNFKKWKFHLNNSIHFTISSSLLTLIQYLPVFIISILLSPYEVGLFSAPLKIVITVCAAGMVINTSLYPIFTDCFEKDKTLFKKLHIKFQIAMLILGIPIGITGSLLGDEIVKYILGNHYLLCANTFKLLVWLIPLYFQRFVLRCVLQASGFQRLNNISSIISLLCVVVVCFILISKLGIVGASLSLLITEFINICSLATICHLLFYSTTSKYCVI